MSNVEHAYNQVRSELAEVGLLAEGLYLDCIELCVSDYPCTDELGYLFEEIGPWARLGFKPGVRRIPEGVADNACLALLAEHENVEACPHGCHGRVYIGKG